jgi:hypothetical protein
MNEVACETIVPTVEEVVMKDQEEHLADYALGLLRALRDLEQRKDKVDPKVYIAMADQMWAALDDITLRLFATCIEPRKTQSN